MVPTWRHRHQAQALRVPSADLTPEPGRLPRNYGRQDSTNTGEKLMQLKLSPAEALLAKPLMKIFYGQQFHVEGCEGDGVKCPGCIQERQAMSELKDLDSGLYNEMKRQGCSI